MKKFKNKSPGYKYLKYITRFHMDYPLMSLILSGKGYITVIIILYMMGYNLHNPIVVIWAIAATIDKAVLFICLNKCYEHEAKEIIKEIEKEWDVLNNKK
jgi:hypothetical protein